MSIEITIDNTDLSEYIAQELEDAVAKLSLVTEDDLAEYTERALQELAPKFITELEQNAFKRGHTAGYEEGYKTGFNRGLNKGYESQAKNFEQI